jgi:prepilin-type N-terminal cleavage/methylation domain-containing protein
VNLIQRHLAKHRDEEGFTLIELLIVIIILGILAGIVIFAAGGLGDKGQKSACKTDAEVLRTAEEGFLSQSATAVYGTQPELKTAKLIVDVSPLHTITLGVGSKDYTITRTAGAKCAGYTDADYVP